MDFLKENAPTISDRMNLKNLPVTTPVMKKLKALTDVRNTIHGRNMNDTQFLFPLDSNRDLRSPSPCQRKEFKIETVMYPKDDALSDCYFTSDCCYDAQDEEDFHVLFPSEYRLSKEDIGYFATNLVGKYRFEDYSMDIPSPCDLNFDKPSDVDFESNDFYLRDLNFNLDVDLSSSDES